MSTDRMPQTIRALTLPLALLSLGCGGPSDSAGKGDAKTKTDAKTPAEPAKPLDQSKKVTIDVDAINKKKTATPEEAKAFVTEVDAKLRELWVKGAEAEWRKATDITDEHEKLAAAAAAQTMAYETKAIKDATRFDGLSEGDPEVLRQIKLLKLTSTLPAPEDEAKRNELAEIASSLDGMYGKGKWCADPAEPSSCQDLGALSAVLAEEAAKVPGSGSAKQTAKKPGGGSAKQTADSVATQLAAWEHWRTVSVPMRDKYSRFVELGNEGAKAIGYADVGQLWRSRYDMSPEAFEQEVDRLWGQVKPLYDALHCHVRAKLHERYGDAVPQDGLIPAHLVGNMWAQDWVALYPSLEPYPGEPSLDVTKALVDAKYDEIKMVKSGEAFFTSMGLNPLPETFWERSMFEKPEGKDAVCHASAWDVGLNNDLRIKMCIKIDHEDFVTIHHELGHDYYFNNYYTRPVLFQNGAHDGFHEAIGDAIALSITPAYLEKIGLLSTISSNDKGVINKQMQDALQKIAFLPFGKLVDQWRWDVFSGKTTPQTYNADWWTLRASEQGVGAPTERGEEYFDPGAKYHIPANTPYARYFLAHILQFQFHKAMCAAAGHDGPLHECSVYGSKEAGAKLQAMLAMGASQPWPDALEKLTGTREMDGSALIEYFGPLMAYLEEQNEGRTCGWSTE